MSVEHGGVRPQAESVSLAVNAQPAIGVGLVLADEVADFGMEDFRPAAGKAAEAGFLEFGENVARAAAREPRKPIPFDGCVRFEMQPRMRSVNDADDVEIPVVRKLVMQAADDVQFRGAASLGFGGPVQN